MSGHLFFKERWYGFDDALYAGARLLEILSKVPDGNTLLSALPDAINTPELQIKLKEGENYELITELQKSAQFDNPQQVITTDGLRVEYADGFGLARSSNTALKRIQGDFRKVLLKAKPDAQLPY
jgi:phosphomannomutase/phosphoglucomutase